MKKNYLGAYSVQENRGRSYWTKIGVAFPTKNGGFTVILSVVPPATRDGTKIVLQPPKQQTAQPVATDDLPQDL